MAKKKTVGFRMFGTVSNQQITVNGMPGTWMVSVSIDFNRGSGEMVHTIPSTFPRAVVMLNGTDVGVIILNLSNDPTYSGSGTVNTASRPTHVRVETKFVSSLIPNTYPT